jgi:hypothetical protein
MKKLKNAKNAKIRAAPFNAVRRGKRVSNQGTTRCLRLLTPSAANRIFISVPATAGGRFHYENFT